MWKPQYLYFDFRPGKNGKIGIPGMEGLKGSKGAPGLFGLDGPDGFQGYKVFFTKKNFLSTSKISSASCNHFFLPVTLLSNYQDIKFYTI